MYHTFSNIFIYIYYVYIIYITYKYNWSNVPKNKMSRKNNYDNLINNIMGVFGGEQTNMQSIKLQTFINRLGTNYPHNYNKMF